MIRNYICRKKQKNEFDRKFLKIYEQYLEEGNRAVKILYDMGYETLFSDTCQNIDLCHGDFHQHNLIMQRDGIALVRFDHMHIGVQVSDLYVFMRKILEKNHWNVGLGMAMLDAYRRIVPMDYKEMRCLYALLVFPEKLWKITLAKINYRCYSCCRTNSNYNNKFIVYWRYINKFIFNKYYSKYNTIKSNWRKWR